jgi:4-hydroxythreonine-4-phosphate dehydrogenase
VNPPLRIALTMGDPAGIGPEIIVKAAHLLRDRVASGSVRLLVLGSAAAIDAASRQLGLPVDGLLEMVDVGPVPGDLRTGEVSAAGGEWAYRAVQRAVEMCRADNADAIVTAPLSKEALNLAGHPFAGHTELLAHLTGQRDAVMMLAHGNMRVSHVTTHCALADVPARVTPARLRRVFDLTLEALRSLGIAQPRVAVAALDPHAGEGGLLGRQDMDVIAPVVADYAARGERLSGPHPGDTVFVKLRGGQFDAVVAMYHDQGHIPVKLLGFDVDPVTGAWAAISGVNVTLGLPIIRCSVDHGTAFDIAGRGVANADSLVDAVDYAAKLVAGRRIAMARTAADRSISSVG